MARFRRGPDKPTDLNKRSWLGTVKRTVSEFRDDNATDWAAALTYYGVLSLFPAMIALISILGLVVDPATITRVITDVVSQLGPSSATDTFSGPIEEIASNRSGAIVGLVVGVAAALWTASGYVGAFMRASNAFYEREEGRPFYILRPFQILVTLVLVMMAALVVLSLIVSGPVAEAIGSAVGLGDTAVMVWDIAKWPVMLVVVMVMLAVLYWSSPNAKPAGFRWVSPGSILAVVVWVVASAGIRLLRRQLRLLQQDLRRARRRDRLPRLDVDHQRRRAARRRAERRDRARARDRGGRAGRRGGHQGAVPPRAGALQDLTLSFPARPADVGGTCRDRPSARSSPSPSSCSPWSRSARA